MINFDDKQIKKYVEDALCEVYNKDADLISTEEETHNHEIAIVHRFAHYIENKMRNEIADFDGNFDLEYNRNCNDLKRTEHYANGMRPDFIIHQRGINSGNLLAIEFKTWWYSYQSDDLQKIEDLMKPPYNYKYGCVVLIDKKYNSTNIKWIKL